MKPFRELTRRARLYQARILAQAALEAYGLPQSRLGFIQYGENIIYRVDLSGPVDAQAGPYLPNRCVLRLHAMGNQEAIASEITWLAALNREAELPVPAPVAAPDGRLLVKIFTPGFPNGRVVTLMRWLDGRKIQKGLQPAHLTLLGKVVAQMHNFSAAWQPPPEFTRPIWDWNAQLGGSEFKHTRDELVASMPVNFRAPFECVSRAARAAMESLGNRPDAFGLIHADLYPENVLYKGGRACPIDFEDCGYGYWIWDIAVALCRWAWDNDWERMRDAFFAGYDPIRSLPAAQWEQLDLFVATQFATMVLWSSAFLKNDPKRVAEYEPWRSNNGNLLLRYFERKEK
jgi:Ser/Thr protein kinase RdoA (MazF antagonist)